MYNDELYHHGVKGMKWGVRRYRNYPGTYTQAGVKRFDKSMKAYEHANARYKDAKKTGKSKGEITNARMAERQAKRKLEKDYRHLKQDKLGDKGKDLYSRGKTITSNDNVTKLISTIGSMSLAAAKYNETSGGRLGGKKVTDALLAGGLASMGIAGAKKLADENQARKLRAYYSHTSNY